MMAPASLPFVVLKESGFIVGDKNERKGVGRARQGISVIIPKLESCFVFRPSINKGLSIGHHIFSFMAVEIHSICFLPISPLQLGKPPVCRRLRNTGFVDPQLSKDCLHLLARDDLTQVLGLDKTGLCPLCQLLLEFLQDVLVFKDRVPAIAIRMEGKLPISDKVEDPPTDAARPPRPTPLCLRHDHRGLPPGVRKVQVQKQVQDPDHGTDASPKDNVKRLVLALRRQRLLGPQ